MLSDYEKVDLTARAVRFWDELMTGLPLEETEVVERCRTFALETIADFTVDEDKVTAMTVLRDAVKTRGLYWLREHARLAGLAPPDPFEPFPGGR